MTSTPENPGAGMAKMVEEEMAKFRGIQADVAKLNGDLQTVTAQLNENEMVKQELDLVGVEDGTVYKLVGPILMKNDLDDAKQTVEKRLEFIVGEKKRVENSLKEKEKLGNETARRVQELQAAMQQATVEAVKAIQAEQTSVEAKG
eukprot:CAMPEP_0194027416 /NCGR_PEP_ID=MMETSP0009_2-20130614/1571_1 /TAXON_ID=210454 /ORGANISM="Grammatophora oceanica, Strain CCMP 410" /LENGTH=145 /DNA_ID=CAMNT_0038666473 /DNA_START=48 /DNA_END=485 /DNA_ORIENTATION=-